jgi:hypothetical protein
MDPSITVFDYKHERVTESIVQEIRVKNLDVGNGVGTVAFMSEDSVTEFHGSHEWAQGRTVPEAAVQLPRPQGEVDRVDTREHVP